MTAEPTRRLLLAVAAGGSLALAGCRGLTALGPVPSVAPAVVTLEHAIAAEDLMVRTYQAAITALGGQAATGKAGRRLAAVLATVLTEHQEHLAHLRSRLIVPPGHATRSPRHGAGQAPGALGTGPRSVVAALVTAERAAAVRLQRQLLAVPPALAQLMASIGASEASHAVILGQVRLAG